MRMFMGAMPPSSAACATPAKLRAASAANATRFMRCRVEVTIAVSSMGRHPVRHALGLFLAPPRVEHEEREEREVDDQPEAAERVLDRRDVRIRAEPFGNLLGGGSRTPPAPDDARKCEEGETGPVDD